MIIAKTNAKKCKCGVSPVYPHSNHQSNTYVGVFYFVERKLSSKLPCLAVFMYFSDLFSSEKDRFLKIMA